MIEHHIHSVGVDKDISNAILLLIEALGEQKHRDGKPAILHSIHVGMEQEQFGKDAMILGFIHDVLEDGGMDFVNTITKLFGSDMVRKVLTITRMHTESYQEYIVRIIKSNDRDCIRVKLSDIEHNMHPSRSDRKARKKAVEYGNAYDLLSEALKNI